MNSACPLASSPGPDGLDSLAAGRANAGMLCRDTAVAVSEALDLAEAARTMRDRHVRFLVVTDRCTASVHNIVGIVTDRDIVTSVVAREADPRRLTVSDVMTRPPLLIGAEYPLDSLARLMRGAGARCAPVIARNGELLGVLAYDDVLERVMDQIAGAPERL